MTVGGLGKQFAAGVLDSDEGFGGRGGVSGNPGDTTVGGVFDAVIGRVDSNQLVAVCD